MKHAVYQAQLTSEQQAAILALEGQGQEKGIHYKIDPGTSSGIPLTEDGSLVGFMTADFNGSQVEAAAIAGNAADWNAMAAALQAQARKEKATQALYIADPNDTAVTQLLLSMGLKPAFSEYRMVFDPAAFSPVPAGSVTLRPALSADSAYVTKLDAEGFAGTPQPISSQDLANTRLILQDGKPVGKLRLDPAGGTCGIYGVVIDPRLRGQGIGTRALTLTLEYLMGSKTGHIYLEVDSQNPAAFHLYQKLGFRVMSEFRYYPYALV